MFLVHPLDLNQLRNLIIIVIIKFHDEKQYNFMEYNAYYGKYNVSNYIWTPVLYTQNNVLIVIHIACYTIYEYYFKLYFWAIWKNKIIIIIIVILFGILYGMLLSRMVSTWKNKNAKPVCWKLLRWKMKYEFIRFVCDQIL
jgi:hypothetical protein